MLFTGLGLLGTPLTAALLLAGTFCGLSVLPIFCFSSCSSPPSASPFFFLPPDSIPNISKPCSPGLLPSSEMGVVLLILSCRLTLDASLRCPLHDFNLSKKPIFLPCPCSSSSSSLSLPPSDASDIALCVLACDINPDSGIFSSFTISSSMSTSSTTICANTSNTNSKSAKSNLPRSFANFSNVPKRANLSLYASGNCSLNSSNSFLVIPSWSWCAISYRPNTIFNISRS
mmetsp:Transcript_2541/g.4117  ORF Transcript_2541/g.4117 Transcript_2541/m.4117 type:complete len:230 (-) Transcript_2541:568-1257(-)